MADFRLTNKALEDLNGIWDYTYENWSEEQADRYYEMLLQSCQYLADNPGLGRNYEGIAKNLYGFKSSRHIIFYRNMVNEPIEITRILHSQMDLKSRILE